MEDNGGIGALPDEIPDDPPGRGQTAYLPISSPPAEIEIEAALTAFFDMTGGSWLYFQAIASPDHVAGARAHMAAALTAAGEACAGRKA